MRVQDHIGLISWSLADKALFILYGFVLIVIMNYTVPAEFGLYSLLIGLHTWIFTISDSFSLQSLIQFGMNERNRGKVNLIALVSHLSLTLGISLLVFVLRYSLAGLFDESRILDIASFLPVLSLAFIPRTYSQKIIYRIQNMFYLFLTNLTFFGTMAALIFIKISSVKFLTFNDLAYIYLYGSMASSAVALVLIRKELIFTRTGDIGWRQVYNFSWKMTLANIMYSLPRQLDVFFVKIFFSLNEVGFYAAAKNIFRVFDEALGAVNGIIYPEAVKLLDKKNYKDFSLLATKSLSFLFVSFFFAVVILYFGLADIIFNWILPERFMQSLVFFKVILLAALFLPFQMLFLFIISKNRLNILLFYYLIGLLVFTITIVIIGYGGFLTYMPIALVSYYGVMSILVYLDSIKNLKLKLKDLFRSILDTKDFFIKN